MTTQQKDNNVNMQTIVIIILLIIIVVMGYFLGQKSAIKTTPNTPENNISDENTEYEDLTITVIDDKRCTNCPTEGLVTQLQLLPSVQGAELIKKDFSDDGVEAYLKENNIKALPLIVFSTNNFDVSKDPVQTDQSGQPTPKVNKFLQPLPNGDFNLEVGSIFDPFKERSERGFLMLDKADLAKIKTDVYIKGKTDANITWIEYSDLECPYCAKLHNSGTIEEVFEKYSDDVNMIYNHFPLGFHDNAQPGAEILECLGEQKGENAFYDLIKKSYTDEKSTKSYLIDEAVALGGSKESIEKCLEDGTYTQKVKDQMQAGTDMFGVTGTPGNVLINNETGEYEVISGAYPTSAFEELIEKLK